MRKFIRIIGTIFLSLLGLIIIGVGVLSITGFPRPARIEARNVSKASISQVPDIIRLMSSAYTRYELIRHDGSQIVLLKNGQPMTLDVKQKAISSSEKFVPRTGLFGQTQYHDGFYYFLEENPNTEDRVLLSMEEATGKVDTLFTGAKGTYDFKLSEDGKEIVLVDQEDATGKYFLYRIDSETAQEPQLLTEPDELISFQSFGPDRSYMVIQEILVSGQVRYRKLDLENLSFSPYESRFDSTYYFLSNTARIICNNQSYTNNFGTSYFIRTGDSGLAKEFNTLFELKGDSLRQISPEMMADVGHVDLSHDDRFVVFTANSGGFGKIFAYDRTNHLVKTVYDDEEYNLDWFNSAPFLITDDHQVIYSVNNFYGAKLMMSNLLTAETEVVDAVIQEDLKDVMQFAKFTYPTTSDIIGVMTGIEAYIYKPDSSPFDKMPVVIELHGGPAMPAFPYQVGLGHYFIEKGITIISPNYRGSEGYGESFEASDNLRERYKQVADIKALHDWIKTQPDLDSDKVYLMGASHGGYMVMAALSQFPGLFVGGMSLAGVSDNSLVMHENNYHSKSWKHEFGDFSDPLQRPMLDSISPLYSAHRITEPLLLIHGTEDPRVVCQNSDKMADAIDAAGGRVHYLKLVGSGHAANPEGPLEAFYMMSVTFDFIEELLMH